MGTVLMFSASVTPVISSYILSLCTIVPDSGLVLPFSSVSFSSSTLSSFMSFSSTHVIACSVSIFVVGIGMGLSSSMSSSVSSSSSIMILLSL